MHYHEILKLENGFFEEGSADFYRRVVADEAMLVLPGMGRLSKQQCVDAASSSNPWTSHTMEQVESVEVAPGVVALSYKATAQRGDKQPYVAWMSSVWARSNGHWQLVLHQQTPLSE